jgi:hypothetical protein
MRTIKGCLESLKNKANKILNADDPIRIAESMLKDIDDLEFECSSPKCDLEDPKTYMREKVFYYLKGYKQEPTSVYEIQISMWNCLGRVNSKLNNPIDRCVYDHGQDPGHYSCLFCGEPEERK